MSTLQDLADRQAIADLIHTYARHVREGTGGQCGDLFTGDGVFEMREKNPHDPASDRQLLWVEGLAAVRKFIGDSTQAGPVRICPLIHNLLITLKGDTARAGSVVEGRSFPPGSEVLGVYDDALRRTADGWRFARRTFTFLRAAG